MFKKIYVLIGISASGKSTFTEGLFLEGENPITFNADTIRGKLYGDPTIQGDGKVVFDVLFEAYTKALKDDIHDVLVIDNTSLTYKIRKRYYALATTICPMFEHEFKYHLVYFNPNLERSLEWNSKRERKVPEDVIRGQFERLELPNDIEKIYSKVIVVD
jgi:predicted kinase